MIFLVIIGYNVIKYNGFDNESKDPEQLLDLKLIVYYYLFSFIVYWNYEKRSPVTLPDQDEEKKIMNFMS